MTKEEKEQLKEVVKSGYDAAIEDCFDGVALYTQGFIDGIMYQKHGTIPKGKWQALLDKIDEKIN